MCEASVMTRFVLLALGLLVFGCNRHTVITVSGIEVYEEYWRRAANEVTARATFDMSCPAEELELHLLMKVVRRPSQIGVDGCGRRVTYVLTDSGWVANVESSTQP